MVKPSIVYLESEMIRRGWDRGTNSMAIIITVISPIWFDCMGPGTLMAAFSGLLGPAQTPALQMAFLLLLFIQAPSVYTVILGFIRVQPVWG